MKKKKYTYFEEDGMFIGWLDEFSDYKTQGETLEELTDNLRDIYQDLTGGPIPNVLHSGELLVA